MTSRARGLANFFSPAVAATVGDAAGGGVEAFADVNSLPGNPSLGDLAFITGTNTLYVYNGSAWFNIAIANQAPTAISGNQASYLLSNDGSPTVVTLVSNDPEGFPLTWSYSGDPGTTATVSQADNVFTITPSTNVADTDEFSLTFSVTDGSNTETTNSSFSLVFARDGNASWNYDYGVTQRINANNDFSVQLGEDITVEAYIYPEVNSPAAHSSAFSIATISNSGTAYGNALTLAFAADTGNNTIQFQAAGGSGSISGASRIGIVSGYNYAPNQWYHVAVSIQSDTWRLFVDGVQVASGTPSGQLATSKTLYIGGTRDTRAGAPNETGPHRTWNLRITRSALYTSNFTPPVGELDENIPNCVLLTAATDQLVDFSPSNHTIVMDAGTFAFSADTPLG